MGFNQQAVDFVGTMGPAAKEDLHLSLKTCFDLAVHVSPLTLLANLPAKFSMIRGKLIQVSRGRCAIPRVHATLTALQYGQDLGSKPDYVAKAEEVIWGAVVGIAMGQNPTEQLQWLTRTHSALFDELEANADNVGKYFVNGTVDKKADVEADIDVQMSMNDDTTETGYPMDIDQTAGPSSLPLNGGTAMSPNLDAADPVNDVSSPKDSRSLGEGDELAMQTGDVDFPRPPPPPPAEQPAPATPETAAMSPDHDLANTISRLSPAQDDTATDRGPNRARSDTSSPLTDLDELPDVGTALAAPVAPKVQSSGRIVIPGGKFAPGVTRSGRPVIPAAKFASGATLTHPSAPAPKKRKLENQGRNSGPMTVSMKEEELYWTSTLAYVTAAVSLLRYSPSCVAINNAKPRRLMSTLTLPPPRR